LSVEARVTVDTREAKAAKSLVSALRARGLSVSTAKLYAGDYLVEGGENFLVERTTLNDFARKIMDARLWEQVRAMSSAENVTPVMLVEYGKLYSSISLESVYGALLSVALDWRIPLLFSPSRMHTVAVIEGLHRRAGSSERRTGRPFFKPKAASSGEELVRVVASLPGVGVLRARKLLERFKTIQALANASVEELMETSGIGEALSKRIYEAFRREFKPEKM
jgi:Fanconi anemia group M protein